MMYVKICSHSGAPVTLYECTRVRSEWTEEAAGTFLTLEMEREDGSTVHSAIELAAEKGMSVFVMNADGKTIERLLGG